MDVDAAHLRLLVVRFGLAALCVAPIALSILPKIVCAHHQRIGCELVKQLRDLRPAEASPVKWETATGWALTAYWNVCFSPEHASLEELKSLQADLGERLRGSVDLATVDWIWQRLGSTGPRGRRYQQRFEPQYRESLTVETAAQQPKRP